MKLGTRSPERGTIIIFLIFIIALSGCAFVPVINRVSAGGDDAVIPCVPLVENDFLRSQTVVVFPFIDKRAVNNEDFSTEVPFSKVMARNFVYVGKKCGLFGKIDMAVPDFFENKTVDLSPANYNSLKKQCNATAIMWGEITAAGIKTESEGFLAGNTVTLEITGTLKIMFSSNKTFYSHAFTFRNMRKSMYTYPRELLSTWGEFYAESLQKAASQEYKSLSKNSKGSKSRPELETDISPNILKYPQAGTLCYDKNYSGLRIGLIGVSASVVMLVSTLVVLNSYKNAGYSSGFDVFPIPFFGGLAAGSLLGLGIYQIFFDKDAYFYARQPRLNPDVVLSMNVYNNRF